MKCRTVLEGLIVACLMWLLAACTSQPRVLQHSNEPPADTCPTTARPSATASAYGRKVLSVVESYIYYPPLARYLGEEGEVDLCLGWPDSWKLTKVLVDRSSGSALLDGAAVYSVGLAAALGEIPEPTRAFLHSSRWLELPIQFILKNPGNHAAVLHPTSAEQQRAFIAKSSRDVTAPAATDGTGAPSKICRIPPFGQWSKVLRRRAARYLQYPPAFVAAGIQGTVRVRIEIDGHERLLRAAIVRSSGLPIFDGMALFSLGSVFGRNELPPVPDSCRGAGRFTVEVPIRWELRSG